MDLLSIITLITGIIMSLSYYPQAFKIFKRKQCKDISPITFLILFLGGVIWLIYGIVNQLFVIAISFSIGIIGVLLVLIGYFLYH